MARPAHLGLKVRNLRQLHGLSQVEAAARLGISASYLNLIEHNQRPLTVNLLFKVGQLFDIDLRDWSEGDESRLAASLREVLADPTLSTIDVPDSEINEAAVGAPNLVQAVSEMYAAYREAMNNVNTLGDRIAEQAVLPGAAMEVRTVLTSIRSFSEILREHENLDPRQRQQFLSILIDESDRLVSVVEAASDAAEQNRLRATTGRRQPVEEISRFMERHENHFAELETVAEPLLDDWSGAAFELPGHLARMLEALGIAVRFVDEGRHVLTAEALRINGTAATEEIAATLAGEIGGAVCRQAITGLVDEVTAPAAQRPLLVNALKGYFARALLMPYQRFLDDAVEVGYDLDQLGQRYHATPLDVARRLATLRRPGARGVPFHLIVFDAAGNVRERLTGSGMALPRFGSSCPRWLVHRVRTDSTEALIDRAEMPDGGVFMCLSRDGGRRDGHAGPRLAFSIGCAASRAAEVAVFAGRMDAPLNPVGVNCRICPREDCAERAFDSLIGRAG